MWWNCLSLLILIVNVCADGDSSSSDSTTIIIVAAAVAGGCVLLLLLFCCCYFKRKGNNENNKINNPRATNNETQLAESGTFERKGTYIVPAMAAPQQAKVVIPSYLLLSVLFLYCGYEFCCAYCCASEYLPFLLFLINRRYQLQHKLRKIIGRRRTLRLPWFQLQYQRGHQTATTQPPSGQEQLAKNLRPMKPIRSTTIWTMNMKQSSRW